MRVREIKWNRPLRESGITDIPRERQRCRKKTGKMKEGWEKRKSEGKVEKNQRSISVCLHCKCATLITACVRTRLMSTTNQRRSCGCQVTLRGYWGTHSTEEWGNIMVSSFGSQHHVERVILIAGFTGFVTAPVIDFTLCFLQRTKSNDLSGRLLFIYTFMVLS